MSKEAVPKYATRRDRRRKSWGAEIAATAEMLGVPLMPWQRDVVDVSTEYTSATEIPYRRDVLVTVPRQSGKSVLVMALIVWWLRKWPNQYAVITAQTRQAATNRLRHISRALGAAHLDHQFLRAIGAEKIIMPNGSQVDVVAPTEKSVHGESVDLAVIDEAWAVDETFLQGVVPAMIARPKAQMWVTSTAGTQASHLLTSMVATARKNPQGRIAYTDYSMPDDAVIYDRDRWHEYMPALGHTITSESVAAAVDLLAHPEAVRAFGNLPTSDTLATAIPAEWASRSVVATITPPLRPAVAVDVNRTPPGWAIAVAWHTSDGHYHMDIAAHGHELELSHIPGQVRDLVQRYMATQIGVDVAGPGGALTSDLDVIATDYVADFKAFTASARARADVFLYDLLRAEKVTRTSWPGLDEAMADVRSGQRGDVWWFDRPKSPVDLSPLLACSMAVWLAHHDQTHRQVPAIY